MHLGFSYIGLIFLIMLMIPNLYWTKNQPKDYEKYVHNENKILLLFERAGEVLVACLLLIFSDFNIIYNKNSPTSAGSEMNCRSEHKCSKEFYK